jgi:hypothetical protein
MKEDGLVPVSPTLATLDLLKAIPAEDSASSPSNPRHPPCLPERRRLVQGVPQDPDDGGAPRCGPLPTRAVRALLPRRSSLGLPYRLGRPQAHDLFRITGQLL